MGTKYGIVYNIIIIMPAAIHWHLNYTEAIGSLIVYQARCVMEVGKDHQAKKGRFSFID